MTHYAILTAMLAPAFFLTATAALLGSANSRLARVIDRTRALLRELADAFGLAVGAAYSALAPLVDAGKVIEGRYRQGVSEQEYVAVEVLRIIRSRSLAAARAQTRPVSQSAFGRFLPSWSHVAPAGQVAALRGGGRNDQAEIPQSPARTVRGGRCQMVNDGLRARRSSIHASSRPSAQLRTGAGTHTPRRLL